ncbi:adhesin, partial [Moraxella catarrhalis]|nr:adhesin [Moraxella catarrhalis]
LYNLSQSPLTFEGDTGDSVKRKLGDTLKVQGGENTESKLTENNIGVVANSTNGLTVKLAKTLNGLTEVKTETLTANTKVKVGNGTNIAELQSGSLTFTPTTSTSTDKTVYGVDGVKFTDGSGNTPLAGTTYITKEKIGFAKDGAVDTDKPYLDQNKLKVGTVEITKNGGIDAGNKKISNITDGDSDNDAVTYGQFKKVKETANSALQSFTVQKVNENGNADDNETITVAKDKAKNASAVNTLKLKGTNGLTVATSKANGTV